MGEMFDPYKILGVRRNASAATIRKAFRNRAKTAHPDAGGKPGDFEALNRAHAVLADPARRKRYDETGVADDGVDTAEQEAMNAIAQLLAHVIESDLDVAHTNVAKKISEALLKEQGEKRKQIKRLDRARKRIDAMLGRFTRDEGENLLDAMLRSQIGHIDTVQKGIEARIATLKRANEIVEQYGYRFDQQTPMMVFRDNSMASSTGTSNWA